MKDCSYVSRPIIQIYNGDFVIKELTYVSSNYLKGENSNGKYASAVIIIYNVILHQISDIQTSLVPLYLSPVMCLISDSTSPA